MAGRIKWSRGFFRLWILLSAVWVVIVGVFSWPQIHKPFVPSHVFIEYTGDRAWGFFSDEALKARELVTRKFYVEVEVEGAPGITYIGAGGEKLANSMKQKAPLMVDFYEAQVSTRRASALRSAASFGLVPPLILIIAGALVAWALRGFRDDRGEGAA